MAKKILSIDDEPTMLTCLKNALTSRGYEFCMTTDPDEGLKIIREDKSLSLAMLDVRMPKKDGFQIYTEFREFRKLPVLFVTAYPKSFTTNSDDIVDMWQKEFADGTTDIVYKPFDLDTLFEKVQALIGPAEDGGDN
ncbi:MAG: response regulator [Lentisphaerae bacterium]|nr:response regulator [Lentisphaerota bacterium]